MVADIVATAIAKTQFNQGRDVVPASWGQEQLWLTHQLDAVGDAYHFVRVLHLQGELNLAALDATFGQIIARHEWWRRLAN